MLKIYFYRILLLVWVVALFILSFYTPAWLHSDFLGSFTDKFKHIIGAFILALLLSMSVNIKSISKYLLLFGIVSLLFEIVQHKLTHGNREFSIWDVLANIFGFYLGYIVFLRIKSKSNKTNT